MAKRNKRNNSKMEINVDTYVDIYIHYHASRFINNGGLEEANSYFAEKYDTAISGMRKNAIDAQAKAIGARMRARGTSASQSMDIAEGLAQGDLLETTFESIADELNKKIEQTAEVASFEELLQQSGDFYNLLSEKQVETASLKEFFSLLMQAMNLMNGYPKSMVVAFNKMGKKLTGDKNFSMSTEGGLNRRGSTLTMSDLKTADKIIEILDTATQKFAEKGSVNKNSFRTTVTQIFSRVIGENFAKNILASIVQEVTDDVDAQLTSIPNLFPSDKTSKAVVKGASRDSLGKTSKVDVFNQDAFKLEFEYGGRQCEVALSTNISAKWYKELYDEGTANVSLVSRTPVGTYFKDGGEKYLAYNVLAHSFSSPAYHQAYRILRASTAASFLQEWMSGTGAKIKGGFINKAQFLMINGRIYSVMSIINAICNELMDLSPDVESADSPINLRIGGLAKPKNEWQAPKNPNWQGAWRRAQLVKGIIDRLQIYASFDSSVLNRYAGKTEEI